MKVCLINAPWEQGDRWGIRSGCRFPNLMIKHTNSYVPFPFLLAYTASYLERLGFETRLLDGVAERTSAERFCAQVADVAPDLIIAETATSALAHDLRLFAALKARLPQSTMAAFGPHVSARPQDGLAGPAVDYVIRGEPELTAGALVQTLAARGDPANVPGLSFRRGDGTLIETAARPPLKDVDDLPYPRRDGLPMDRYVVPGFPAPTVFMYGSRGCPCKCSFCLWPQTLYTGAPYRPRAAEKIADEIADVLRARPETRSLFFDDDTFNIGRGRLLAFADALDARGIRLPWGMNARADGWDEALLRRLKETGLFTLRIGIESGDESVLRRSHKGIDLTQARQMLQMSARLGIQNHLSFMVGLPGETPQTVENTIRFIKSVPADSVQFSVAVPFPGTSFYREAEADGHLVSRNWADYNGHDQAVVRTDAMSADDILRAITHARRRVYFSPRFIWRRLRYMHDVRDLGAVVRKVARLVVQPA